MTKSEELSGREHYREIYKNQLDKEAEWLRRGAVEKVNSIEMLLRNNHIRPKSLLELGCGTGAVITECQRRGFAERYCAVDYSEEAIDYLRSHSQGIKTMAADITTQAPWRHETWDVVVLSHVLEHLEDPSTFLQSVQTLNFSYLVAEIPLEDLFLNFLKSLIRDRSGNLSGHVQFFTAKSFTKLLTASGFRILDQRRYVPIWDCPTVRFVTEKNNLGKAQYYRQILTAVYLPTLLKPIWSALYYAHYAALCQKISPQDC